MSKSPQELAKEAATQVVEYAELYRKIAQAPEWLKSYMEGEFGERGAGRPAPEAAATPALEGGQMMYVKPDQSNLQGIAMGIGAKTVAEFMAAHMNSPEAAKALAPAAHEELKAMWPKLVAEKGAGKAGVIADAFADVFKEYGLGAVAAKAPSNLSKLAQSLQTKYLKK